MCQFFLDKVLVFLHHVEDRGRIAHDRCVYKYTPGPEMGVGRVASYA
jgi:hypothetical protein